MSLKIFSHVESSLQLFINEILEVLQKDYEMVLELRNKIKQHGAGLEKGTQYNVETTAICFNVGGKIFQIEKDILVQLQNRSLLSGLFASDCWEEHLLKDKHGYYYIDAIYDLAQEMEQLLTAIHIGLLNKAGNVDDVELKIISRDFSDAAATFFCKIYKRNSKTAPIIHVTNLGKGNLLQQEKWIVDKVATALFSHHHPYRHRLVLTQQLERTTNVYDKLIPRYIGSSPCICFLPTEESGIGETLGFVYAPNKIQIFLITYGLLCNIYSDDKCNYIFTNGRQVIQVTDKVEPIISFSDKSYARKAYSVSIHKPNLLTKIVHSMEVYSISHDNAIWEEKSSTIIPCDIFDGENVLHVTKDAMIAYQEHILEDTKKLYYECAAVKHLLLYGCLPVDYECDVLSTNGNYYSDNTSSISSHIRVVQQQLMVNATQDVAKVFELLRTSQESSASSDVAATTDVTTTDVTTTDVTTNASVRGRIDDENDLILYFLIPSTKETICILRQALFAFMPRGPLITCLTSPDWKQNRCDFTADGYLVLSSQFPAPLYHLFFDFIRSKAVAMMKEQKISYRELHYLPPTHKHQFMVDSVYLRGMQALLDYYHVDDIIVV